MNIVTKKCDRCGRLKMESNRWWVMVRLVHGYAVFPAERKFKTSWEEEMVGAAEEVYDLCSERCVISMEQAVRDMMLCEEG